MEYILCTTVFPKMIELFIVQGRKACGFFYISKRFSQMLSRCLPKCQEPHYGYQPFEIDAPRCGRPAIHVCKNGKPICCKHSKRFDYIHVNFYTDRCLCSKEREFNPVLAWNSYITGQKRKVTIDEFYGFVMVRFWNGRNVIWKHDVTRKTSRNTSDFNSTPMELEMYLFLLYYCAEFYETGVNRTPDTNKRIKL